MRFRTKLVLLGGVAYAVKWVYETHVAPRQQGGQQAGGGGAATDAPTGERARIGYDTPTGTDPNAKYAEPGYEGKSFGQAVNQDQELVDRLVQDTDGDLRQAAQAFRDQSAGAPALERQEPTRE
jgi:hypothetical protein